jgi:ketol-acid reductoisomerase
LLKDFMKTVHTDVIGKTLEVADNGVDNQVLIAVNDAIRNHPVEYIGEELRGYMTAMQKIV